MIDFSLEIQVTHIEYEVQTNADLFLNIQFFSQ